MLLYMCPDTVKELGQLVYFFGQLVYCILLYVSRLLYVSVDELTELLRSQLVYFLDELTSSVTRATLLHMCPYYYICVPILLHILLYMQ
jgi:hypothetical protein